MNSNILNNPDSPEMALKPKAVCNFSSPADDFIDGNLDLNQYLIKHPAATFFVRAVGESLRDVGILNDDLLIVDRSLTPKDNSIIIAVLNGELILKRLKLNAGKGFLYPVNKKNTPIPIDNIEGFQFWGVVTHAIHDVRIS